jgi:hypothetical protein
MSATISETFVYSEVQMQHRGVIGLILLLSLTVSIETFAENDISQRQGFGFYDPCRGSFLSSMEEVLSTALTAIPYLDWIHNYLQKKPLFWHCVCRLKTQSGMMIDSDGQVWMIEYQCAWCSLEHFAYDCSKPWFPCCQSPETWSVCPDQYVPSYGRPRSKCEIYFFGMP